MNPARALSRLAMLLTRDASTRSSMQAVCAFPAEACSVAKLITGELALQVPSWKSAPPRYLQRFPFSLVSVNNSRFNRFEFPATQAAAEASASNSWAFLVECRSRTG